MLSGPVRTISLEKTSLPFERSWTLPLKIPSALFLVSVVCPILGSAEDIVPCSANKNATKHTVVHRWLRIGYPHKIYGLYYKICTAKSNG